MGCRADCFICLDPHSCTCEKAGNYYYNTVCVACLRKCRFCIDSVECLQCEDTYTYLDGACSCIPSQVETEQGCLVCAFDCLLCPSVELCTCPLLGHYLTEDRQCGVCPSLCELCSGESVCNRCIANAVSRQALCSCGNGFYAEEGSCHPCAADCQACSSLTLCTCPQVGFFLVDELTCRPCSARCLMCVSASRCLACEEHFRVVNESCAVECPSKSVWDPESLVCTCISHYSRIGTECVMPYKGIDEEELARLGVTLNTSKQASKDASRVVGSLMMMGGSAILENVIISATTLKTFFFCASPMNPYIYNVGAGFEKVLKN